MEIFSVLLKIIFFMVEYLGQNSNQVLLVDFYIMYTIIYELRVSRLFPYDIKKVIAHV